jgi:orotate phosphoribosyltransferase
VLRGHFLLSSGRHSDVYFEKFRVLEQPQVMEPLARAIADHFRDQGIERVAGPTTGGLIVAYEVARQLGVRAVYVESENGVKTLRRGVTVPVAARVLVVDDVLTTGLSVRETISVMQSAGAEVVGAAALIDRSEQPPALGAPLFAAYRVEAASYAPDAVPEWLAQIPITQPGTRVTGST